MELVRRWSITRCDWWYIYKIQQIILMIVPVGLKVLLHRTQAFTVGCVPSTHRWCSVQARIAARYMCGKTFNLPTSLVLTISLKFLVCARLERIKKYFELCQVSILEKYILCNKNTSKPNVHNLNTKHFSFLLIKNILVSNNQTSIFLCVHWNNLLSIFFMHNTIFFLYLLIYFSF